MWPDPKWLDFLKSSGPQFAGLAAASGLLFGLDRSGMFALPLLVIQGCVVVGVFSACLAVASAISAIIAGMAGTWRRMHSRLEERALKKRFLKYIPLLEPRDRQILAYLLAKQQPTFRGTQDGGYAANLLALGFVIPAAKQGQAYLSDNRPFKIPDPVWAALWERRQEFRHTPVFDTSYRHRERVEVHPWRVPWNM